MLLSLGRQGAIVSLSPLDVTARRVLLACTAVLMFCAAAPLMASRPLLVDNEIISRLQRGAEPGQKLVLERVPLIDGDPATLELERFEVWAPDAKIIVYEGDGKKTH